MLDSALEKLPVHRGEVYRGMTVPDIDAIMEDYEVGHTTQWTAFTSTTKNAERAFEGNVLFIIASLNGRELGPYSDKLSEEEVLFPLLGNAAPGSSRVIDELLSEHEQIRQAAAQLENATGLAKLIFDLGDLLERHIRKEERELFPLFEQHVKAAEAVAIGQELKKVLEAGPV